MRRVPGGDEIRACLSPPTTPRAAISAVASYVPERILTNAELAQRLDTSDEWIVARTGIRERRIGAPGETTSAMGAEAVRRLMAKRGLGPDDIDALIVATVTPDMLFPATACLIQDQLGLRRAWGFDLSAACSGFLCAHHRGPAGGQRRAPAGRRGRSRSHELHHRSARPDHGRALR